MEKYIHNNTTESILEKHTIAEIKEGIFNTLITTEIIKAFSDDLENAGADEDLIKDFKLEMKTLPEEEIKGVLSMPKELRLRNFPKYVQQLENNETTIRAVISTLVEIAQKNGYTLGYHATNIQNIPHGEEWIINGTEVDDRDNKAMAYYSETYTDIFRADRRKYLYVIRSQISPDTDHKRDTSNNWGRASTLAIVHEIDLRKIDELVEERYKKQKEEALEKEKSVS